MRGTSEADVYVEMYEGDNLVGKLRNPFFSMIDDGKKIKSVGITGFVNKTVYPDTKTDREGVFEPLLKKYSFIYMKDSKPVIFDTERKYIHPYYVVSFERNADNVYQGY